MKKQVFALLMAALLLLTACSAPAPAQTAAAEPTQAPVEPAAPTEVPAPEPTATEEPQPESAEFQLEREAGCNQLSIYWTRSSIDFDTSDMWIWFKGKDGRSYPMRWASLCAPAAPTWAAPAGARPPRIMTGTGS